MQLDNIGIYDPLDVFGYIYKTELPDGRMYIGQKWGNHRVLKYFGSSKHLNRWFLKHIGYPSYNCDEDIAEAYGVKFEILDIALTLNELNFQEQYYIRYYKDFYGDDCLNLAPGGTGAYKPAGKFYLNANSIKKSKETKAKRKAAGWYIITQATRDKLSAKAKGRIPWNKGLTKDLDDRVKKLGHLNSIPGNKGQRYSKEKRANLKWFNNGVINYRGKECPEGFESGMLKRVQPLKKDYIYDEERRKKMSETRRIRNSSKGIKNGSSKPIKCIEDNLSFESLHDCCEHYDISIKELRQSAKTGYNERLNKHFELLKKEHYYSKKEN